MAAAKPVAGTVEAARRPTPSSVPAVRPSTAVGLPQAWRDELAQEAKQVSAEETPSISNISFRSGVMSYQGTPVPQNTMSCIVVGSAYERALYDGPFDPNKIKSPICFAITKDGEDSTPHENSLHPQNEKCSGCPMDEWGSAGEGRRGKACKEQRRLALIPTDKLESADDILASEMVMAKVPVTSVRNWSNYVHSCSAKYSVPYWAVVTSISVKPHIKNQFEVSFATEDTVDDIVALEALKTKRGLMDAFVMAPYSRAVEGEQPAAPPPPPKSKAAIKKKF
jgi:hypothetical protein